MPPHDRHEAIIAVLTVDRGRKQILNVAFIGAESIEQALQAERTDAGMTAGNLGVDVDLTSDRGKTLVELRDRRGIMAFGKRRLRDRAKPQVGRKQIGTYLLKLIGVRQFREGGGCAAVEIVGEIVAQLDDGIALALDWIA